MGGALKDGATAKPRRLLLEKPGLIETDNAEAGLTTLSFKSASLGQRTVWIDT